MPLKFTNFATSTLAVGIGPADTIIAVQGGDGALFPALGAGETFYATIENASLQREIVLVTARSTDSLTVTRGQDNTSAMTWLAGDSISLRLNAAALEAFRDETGAVLLTGDQTVAGAKTFTSSPVVPDSSFSLAKLETVPTATVLGRATAGVGAVEELTGAQTQALLPLQQPRVNVSSAATVDLATAAATTDHINITGTTTISAFTVAAGRVFFVRFDAALTLQNSASVITNSGAQIVTQASDTCVLRAVAANVVEVLFYTSSAVRAWQDLTGSRTLGTTYTNSTGRELEVVVSVIGTSAGNVDFSVDSVPVGVVTMASGGLRQTITFTVPAGATYVGSSTGPTLTRWSELR